MHTNGGCNCLRDVRPTAERLRLMRNVHLLVKEVQQLRGNLSLAEEGLANYQQEIERIKAECQYPKYEELRNEIYKLRGEILEARRIGRPPEPFWLPAP